MPKYNSNVRHSRLPVLAIVASLLLLMVLLFKVLFNRTWKRQFVVLHCHIYRKNYLESRFMEKTINSACIRQKFALFISFDYSLNLLTDKIKFHQILQVLCVNSCFFNHFCHFSIVFFITSAYYFKVVEYIKQLNLIPKICLNFILKTLIIRVGLSILSLQNLWICNFIAD